VILTVACGRDGLPGIEALATASEIVLVEVEVDKETLDRLTALSRETGESLARTVHRLLDDGLRLRQETSRMEHCPGIIFRDGPVGRRAAVSGGPDVWELVPEIQGIEIDDVAATEAVAARLELTVSQIRAAAAYYAEYRDEIDAWVERNNSLAESLEAEWRAAQAARAG